MDCRGDLRGFVVHQHDVGRLDGGIGAHGAHRDADVGAGKDRGVVDAVAHEGQLALFARLAQEALHLVHLVFGKQLAVELVDAELLRNRLGNLGAITREHDGLLHACRVQVGDALRRIFLHHVGDDDMAGVFPVQRNMQDGAGKLAVVIGNALLAHELVVAHQHHMLVNHRTHTMAALLGHLRDAVAIDLARERLLNGKRDGMV